MSVVDQCFFFNFFALLVIDNFTQVPTPFMPFDHFSFMLHLKFLTHSSKKNPRWLLMHVILEFVKKYESSQSNKFFGISIRNL